MNHPGRIRLLIALTLLGFSAVVVRLFWIQVVEHSEHNARSYRQANLLSRIERERGAILDRRGRELAVSLRVKSVAANPLKFPTAALRKAAALKLAPILKMPVDLIVDRLERSGEFAWIARKIPDDAARKIEAMKIPGIMLETEFKRYYPHGTLAAHVLGFVGMDDIGLEGIERSMDKELRGPDLVTAFTHDAQGNPIPVNGKIVYPQFNGHSVELTIDLTIQASLEEALKRQVEAFGAKSASAVVIDPATGEILAMATYPTFDPNDVEHSTADVRRNRAITDVFEPGSAFKVFVGSLALDKGKVTPEDHFFCPGHYSAYGCNIHCLKTHGDLNYRRAIEVSCNVAAMITATRLSSEDLYEGLRAFGFGRKTGIELSGEASGLLNPPRLWSGLSPLMIGMGQEVAVTSLQLATASAALANGGRRMQPHLVRGVYRPTGAISRSVAPKVVAQVISYTSANTMANIMEGVVSRGTGAQAKVGYFPVAGKTGTGQVAGPTGGYISGRYNAVFIGWTPVISPLLAMSIVVHDPEPGKGYYGGLVSAPVFHWVGIDALAYMKAIPASDTFVIARTIAGDSQPRQMGGIREGKVIVPDLKGLTLREVHEVLSGLPVEYKPSGTGVAVSQDPEPGELVPIDSLIHVQLAPPGGMESFADIATP